MKISVRIGSRKAVGVGGQSKHDLRHGRQPAYVDPERTARNSVIITSAPAGELRAECEQRRSQRETKRAMRSNAAIATVGIITFDKEAQAAIQTLPAAEQDKLFLKSAQASAAHLGTTLSGLVVHRDESAIHAHFQCPAVRLDGLPVSKFATRETLSQMQDVAAQAWSAHGIERGEKKAAKVARLLDEGRSQAEITAATVHRSVRQLHHDLPAEIAAKEQALAEQERMLTEQAERIAKNAGLLAKVEADLAAGKVSEEKARKRAEAYARRASDAAVRIADALGDTVQVVDKGSALELRQIWADSLKSAPDTETETDRVLHDAVAVAIRLRDAATAPDVRRAIEQAREKAPELRPASRLPGRRSGPEI
ncbi:plasmid recombination protein (plasmid) [Acidithiobacillus sp. M4-SHS-6]|uniref:plasmid recombination protein n=1 Tax=Acidithiobacillus sp. M4-SHS-6 TaxID=3383024 RepID=UPI0039BDEE38